MVLVETFVALFAGDKFAGAAVGHTGAIDVEVDAELLAATGSGVADETLAVLTIGFGADEPTV